MKKLNIILISYFLFVSCGGGLDDAKKVLKNEKVRTTDEFLVKKRKPLIMPPNYEEVLEPNSKPQERKEENDLRNLLKIKKDEGIQGKSSSTENSILDKIKK